LGLAAALTVAGCGSGTSEDPPSVSTPGESPTTPESSGELKVYPIWSYSLPLAAKGTLVVSAAGGQDYPLSVVTDLQSCTIGNLGGIDLENLRGVYVEPGAIVEAVQNLIADQATIIGSFARTADLSVDDNFSFWRLGGDGTENWSSYFFRLDQRWSGSGRDAIVKARMFEVHWSNSFDPIPILAIRVTWTGEAIENLSSATSGATVAVDCVFSPTGDVLFENGAWPDSNDNGILDDDELTSLRRIVALRGTFLLDWGYEPN